MQLSLFGQNPIKGAFARIMHQCYAHVVQHAQSQPVQFSSVQFSSGGAAVRASALSR